MLGISLSIDSKTASGAGAPGSYVTLRGQWTQGSQTDLKGLSGTGTYSTLSGKVDEMTGEIETSALRALTHVIGHDAAGLFGRAAVKDLTGATRPVFMADFQKRKYTHGREISEKAAMTFARASKQFWPIDGRQSGRELIIPSATAANLPVFDTTGLIVEQAKTNLMPNPLFTGAAVGTVGSGGALPTTWDINVSGLIVEILKLHTHRGMRFVRIKLSRTGGTPSSTSPSLRPCGGAGSNVATAGNLIGQGIFRLISKSASVTTVGLKINAGGVSTSQDQSFPLDNTSEEYQRVTVARVLAAAQNNCRLDIGFELSGATVDFDVTLDVGLMDFALAPNETGFSSMFDNSTATRVAPTITVNVPNGTYDRYLTSGVYGVDPIPAWSNGLVVATGAGDVLPGVTRTSTVQRVLYYPPGLSADEKNEVINYYDPIVYGTNLPYAVYSISGETVAPQSPDKPHSMLKAINRSNVFRFELRENEFPASIDGPTGGGKDRCEMAGASRVTHGNEIWFAFDQKFVVLPDVVSSGYFVFCQLHDFWDEGFDTVGAPPPFEIGFVNGTRRFKVDIAGSASNPLTSQGQITQVRAYEGTDVAAADRTYRFVISCKEGFDGSGRLKVWLDGVQICDYSGIMGYNNVIGSYIKFGLYRARYASTVAAEVSNFTMSTTSLARRIVDPLATA